MGFVVIFCGLGPLGAAQRGSFVPEPGTSFGLTGEDVFGSLAIRQWENAVLWKSTQFTGLFLCRQRNNPTNTLF